MSAALDAIAAEEVTGRPAAPGAVPAAAPAAPELSAVLSLEAEAREWAALPEAVGAILSVPMPELQQVYSERNCKNWGDAMAKLGSKYGWKASVVGPIVGLIIASIPLVVPTYVSIKTRRAAAPGAPAQHGPAAASPAAAAAAPAPDKPAKVQPIG